MRNWFLILLIFSITACKNDSSKNAVDISDFVTHDSRHGYSLETPKYFKETVGLNPDALLQLRSVERDVYLIVIEEPKEEVIRNFKMVGIYNDELSPAANYLNVQSNSLTKDSRVIEKGNPTTLEINGMPAMNMELLAQPQGTPVPIYYLLTFVEGEETLYMIMQWTIESQREEFEATFEVIADSFKENQ